jgi:hypothetical protein
MGIRERTVLHRRRAASKSRTVSRQPAREPIRLEAPTEEDEPRMGPRAKWGVAGDEPVVQCAVKGCGTKAIATMRVDPASPRAWLLDVADGDAGAPICIRHADALARCDGWTVLDARRRYARPDLTVARPRRARPMPPRAQIIAAASVDLRRPRATAPAEDLLDAHSPLLQRAFAKSR